MPGDGHDGEMVVAGDAQIVYGTVAQVVDTHLLLWRCWRATTSAHEKGVFTSAYLSLLTTSPMIMPHPWIVMNLILCNISEKSLNIPNKMFLSK